MWNRVGAELKDAAFWHDRIDVPRFLIEFGFIGLATFVVVTSIGPIARNLARAGLILMRAAAALHPLWTRRLITTAVAGIVFLWAGGIAGHMGEQTVEDLGKWVRQKSPDFMPQASNVELGRMVKQKHSGKYNDFVDPQDNVDLQHYIDDAIYGPRRVLNEERKLIGEGGWGIVGALLEAGIILWFVTRTARSVSRDLAAPRPVAKKNVATQTAAMHQGTK